MKIFFLIGLLFLTQYDSCMGLSTTWAVTDLKAMIAAQYLNTELFPKAATIHTWYAA
jgi:hypothetical protein